MDDKLYLCGNNIYFTFRFPPHKSHFGIAFWADQFFLRKFICMLYHFKIFIYFFCTAFLFLMGLPDNIFDLGFGEHRCTFRFSLVKEAYLTVIHSYFFRRRAVYLFLAEFKLLQCPIVVYGKLLYFGVQQFIFFR